ncbi:MAG: hypothetical protein OEZ23_02750, partial [Gammaproteobacteria bacterium]|nr:hypothetical protein [Gammaproteobacteria bacterium]
MKDVLLLIGDFDTVPDGNYLRIANHLLEKGNQVSLGLTDQLHLSNMTVKVPATRVEALMTAGQPSPPLRQGTVRALNSFSLCWVLNLGLKETFLDKMQLLYGISSPVINSVEALLHFKSKYALPGLVDQLNRGVTESESLKHPPSWASSDPEYLSDIVRQTGGSWIIKPPAGSFGREVVHFQSTDPDVKKILTRLSGEDRKAYVLMQQYIQAAAQGEKRVLLAAGRPIGQYHRHNPLDHRNNVSLNPILSPCELTAREMDACTRLGELLLS